MGRQQCWSVSPRSRQLQPPAATVPALPAHFIFMAMELEPKVYVLTGGKALIDRPTTPTNFRYCRTRLGSLDLAASLSQSARLAACPFTKCPVSCPARSIFGPESARNVIKFPRWIKIFSTPDSSVYVHPLNLFTSKFSQCIMGTSLGMT